MGYINRVMLVGKLVRDVEIKRLPSGSSVANLGVSIEETFVNKAGEKRETTTQVEVEVWDHQADVCAKYLSKGRQVLVEGRLKLDQWRDQEGNNRSRLLVRAAKITFLDPRPATEAASGPYVPADPPAPPAKKDEPPHSSEWDDDEIPPF